MNMRERILQLLEKKTTLSCEQLSPLLSVPPNLALGDYALACFKLGGNANQKAQELAGKIGKQPFLLKVEVAGPYLNFFVDSSAATQEVLSAIQTQKEKYGSEIAQKRVNKGIKKGAKRTKKETKKIKKETYIVEFFHANT